MGWVVNAMTAIPLGIMRTHFVRGWVGLMAGLDVCRKLCPTGILSLDHPVHSEVLYKGVLISP